MAATAATTTTKPLPLTSTPSFLAHQPPPQTPPSSRPPISSPPLDPSRALPPTSQNSLALHFSHLHKPSHPVLLANVYDLPSTHALLAHPSVQAIATSAAAIAAVHGVPEARLTLAQNMASVAGIAAAAVRGSKPLTVDLQDGYADVGESVRQVVAAGAVGCTLQDSVCGGGKEGEVRGVEEVVQRVRAAREAAREMGVADFVVNARTDVLLPGNGGSVELAVERGRRYLEAGAKTVFVWGGPKRGVSREEVERLVEGLGGMVNVKLVVRNGYLSAAELKKMGVARVSVGPELFHKAMGAFRAGVDMVLGSDW